MLRIPDFTRAAIPNIKLTALPIVE